MSREFSRNSRRVIRKDYISSRVKVILDVPQQRVSTSLLKKKFIH